MKKIFRFIDTATGFLQKNLEHRSFIVSYLVAYAWVIWITLLFPYIAVCRLYLIFNRRKRNAEKRRNT